MIGEFAALLTALCYATSSTFFSLAGKSFGALVTNRARLLTAVLLLTIVHWIFLGNPVPLAVEPYRWIWLSLSGIIGLAVGDAFLFQAYIWIGPRLGLLMLSLAPVIATILAWIFLGETLSTSKILGILVTLVGIAWVILGRNGNSTSRATPLPSTESSIPAPGELKSSAAKPPNPAYFKGVLAGLGAATGQALGLLLAKKGLGGDFSPLSANVIRMISAAITLWIITLIQGQARNTVRRLRQQPRSYLYILVGAIIGPLTGVSLSLFAIQHANIGVASTIIALPPVFLLPIGYFAFKERFDRGAVVGTLLAISGVGILFLF
jgi:drug/metabolite transporter (DMT)-like permease